MAILSVLYSLLFAFSLVLINPWGVERGEIWTEPKLLAVQLIVTCNAWILLYQRRRQGTLIVPLVWKYGCGLWLLFLGIGLGATLRSPFPTRSLWGQSTLGDGWVFWALLAMFVLSNALVLRQQPTLLRSQLYGLLGGGAIIAVSVFPQVLDWRIDYTATSGLVSLSSAQMLESTVWQNQMPIGLYSNRGHTAFVLAGVAVLSLWGWRWGWVRSWLAIAVCLLASGSLWCTQIRGGGLALLVASLYLLWCCQSDAVRQRMSHRYWIHGIWVCLFGSGGLLAMKNLEQFSTGRLHLWQLSWQGIQERLLWGWGFDGFGISFPFIADWVGKHRGYLLTKVEIAKVLELNDFTFDYQGIDEQLYTGLLITNKAHNLLLDTAISVGLIGLFCYILLWWFFWRCTRGASLLGIEAVAIAYLVYTLTWYESAQFSHFAWWALSVGLGFSGIDRERVRLMNTKQ